ncbi:MULTISPECIES: DUF488 domain-containing protein [unclassified Shinella]|uniref:DUF488 domain-containing protein n=1 Tax=unclassified Shinella TaxID=2643062 RepID=UPI00225C43AE|nr:MULTISPECIES: DUF488 domain-containing protein [unclassified Shinella]MCO5138064.1 DUF488 domain-containing protein [Shinella sp.]MDC7258180.1 DUF488 domain-containing protein [Shinella sp. YE25]CAI0335061.1 conserved hypothetical protein [Rhizobiaceae bacterium]CAK7259376.1 conserved protein of unknown function [Shinella sp. WSC3-e]
MAQPFFTIGHSNLDLADFLARLRSARVERLADIRKMPMSRANPQFNRDTLPDALADVQISYEHIATLGGLRGRKPALPPDINGLWKNRSFHNYADYALSGEFREGLEHLRAEGRRRRCAMMCSEAVWWRCHRRIVADYLIAQGETVFHVMGEGRLEEARLTPGAEPRPDGTVVYPSPDDPVP